MPSRRLWLWCCALAVSSASVGVVADQGCTPSPFRIFWDNYGPGGFVNLSVSEWFIEPGTSTQTGGSCKSVNCTPWSGGLWPTLTSDSAPVNGGVPQAANLTAHLDEIRRTIDGWIPDAAWDGNAVFDFEAWTPSWAGNSDPNPDYHSRRYQNYSAALVQAAHPEWDHAQVWTQAEKDFQAAAVQFFVATLDLCRALRPNARWGFYGFPNNPYMPCDSLGAHPQCGYRNPLLGPALRAQNDALAPIFAASSGLYPSIYLPEGTNSSLFNRTNADYIAGVTEEAVRLAAKYSPAGTPVRPYAWAFYHDGATLLHPQDMVASLAAPLQAGADGVVLWGYPSAWDRTAEMYEYLNSTLGPDAKELVTAQCACAAAQCSGHGACAGPEGKCRCFAGFSGASCNQSAGAAPAAGGGDEFLLIAPQPQPQRQRPQHLHHLR
jgi:hyaluronoglucosaminidase